MPTSIRTLSSWRKRPPAVFAKAIGQMPYCSTTRARKSGPSDESLAADRDLYALVVVQRRNDSGVWLLLRIEVS